MKTILFDLDGTLLPMDQDAFIKAYFGGIATKMAAYDYEPNQLIHAIWAGTGCMVQNDGAKTNDVAFWAGFNDAMGHDCSQDIPLFDDFYRNEFRYVSAMCGFAPRAAELIAMLKDAGCRLILATNPIFPAVATNQRIRWAGLQPEDFSLITTFENSSYCKPNPAYYRQILEKIGETPDNCIMVGNDATEDMIAAELGMGVFLLTDCLINQKNVDISSYSHGDFDALFAYLAKAVNH